MKLSITYLQSINACSKALKWFKENIGEGEYTIKQCMKLAKNNPPSYDDVSFLIRYCTFCQTQEMVEYYKSLTPSYADVRFLIRDCTFCQTQEMVEYYKSLTPSYADVSWLIRDCAFCQTAEIRNILEGATK